MESKGMYIKKEELLCGWLHISFGDESNTFYACCDECLSDPLPCETEIRLINEKVSINPEYEWFLEAFDKMLKEHIVPINWCLDCEKEEHTKRIFEGE